MNETSHSRRAFTLLELLVSITVLLMLAGFVTAIVGAVNRTWAAGEQRVEVYQNGRAILDQMARDLGPALTSPSLQTVQNVTTSALLAGSNTVQVTNSDNLFWQAPGTANTFGNIYEVGYVLVKTTNTTPVDYQLKRFYVAPNTRYPTPYPPPDASTRTFQIYDMPFSAVTAPWLTNMTAANFQGTANLTTLSEGVLGLWVRFLDRNGDPVPWLTGSNTASTNGVSTTYYSVASPMKFNSAAAFNAAVPGQSNSFYYTGLTDYTGAAVVAPTATTTAANAANRLPTSAELTIITLDLNSLKRPGVTIPDPPISTSPTNAAAPGNVPTDINTYLNTLINGEKLTGAQVFCRVVRLQNGTD